MKNNNIVYFEIKNTLVSSATDNNIMDIVVYPNYPDTTDTTPFNWNDCYYYLSLNGLQNCTFFQNEIGTFNQYGTIENAIDLVKMNYIIQYINRCHENLH